MGSGYTHSVRSGGRALLIASVSMVLAAGTWMTSSVLAAAPTGDFAVFSQCPRFTLGVELCIYAQVATGEVKLGREAVPIAHAIEIQGGIAIDQVTEAQTFVAALNGETLTKAPQSVPGGLLGLVNCNEIGSLAARTACAGLLKSGQTSVTATTELARPAVAIGVNLSNLVNAKGTTLSLPVRIHLTNPLLGSGCYVGSSSKPIVLELTSGATNPSPPNRPIAGRVGDLTARDGFEVFQTTGSVLVDNAFSVPGASGCGGIYSPLIDSIIDRRIGLPSTAGSNTAVLGSDLDEGTTVGVIASEG